MSLNYNQILGHAWHLVCLVFLGIDGHMMQLAITRHKTKPIQTQSYRETTFCVAFCPFSPSLRFHTPPWRTSPLPCRMDS